MFYKNILVVIGCVIAGVLAAPADVPPEKLQPTVIPILAQSEELEPNGTYKFSYETGNGIIREETAYEKVLPKAREASSSEGGEDNDGDSNEIHVQRGSYSYTAPDGTVISVSYIADENGFQPIGEHIPRSPVLVPTLSNAEKSGRALKLDDNSKSGSAPTKANTIEKPSKPVEGNAKPEAAPKISVPVDESKSKPPVPEETKAESIPVSSTVENSSEPVSTSNIEQNESTPLPTAVTQEAKSNLDVSTTEQVVEEAKSTATEAGLSTTEAASTIAEGSTTEVSLPTSTNVELSTDAGSTVASAQSTTESEVASTASTDQDSTSAPESTTSSDVSEESSSTQAPESASTSEGVESSSSTESVNQSTTEEAGQSSPITSESASTEQASTATTAQQTV